jgi:exosortase C (VPDSG-CTERM-specific)
MNTPEPSREKTELGPTAHHEDSACTGGAVWNTTLRRTAPLGFFAFAILLAAVFIKPLLALAIHAARSDLHSYILLVPFISAYLVRTRRSQLPKEYGSSPGWATVPLLAGLAALAAAWTQNTRSLSHNDYLTLMALSFICLLTAGGFLFLGRKWMAAAAFPFAFLIFMVPMPDAMADALETASKLASAEAANLFFDMTGTPVLRDGTIFQLPNIVIQVAQECSGIRSSLVLLITSLLAANLFLKSTWRRAVLVCFVIPLGIVRNGFRVWVIGTLCIQIGPRMIHSVIHRRGGPLFFALSLIPLFLLLWLLRRGQVATSQKANRKTEVSGHPPARQASSA